MAISQVMTGQSLKPPGFGVGGRCYVHLSLSEGLMPFQHLRPLSGRDHIQSYNLFIPVVMIIYLMKETRRKPTTGIRCPTHFDNVKFFDDPIMGHWGGGGSRRPVSNARQTRT